MKQIPIIYKTYVKSLDAIPPTSFFINFRPLDANKFNMENQVILPSNIKKNAT